MRRVAHTALLALLAALAVCPSALAASALAPLSPNAPANAALAACHRSPAIEARDAVVSTWMHPLPGAPRLALRIDLEQRPLGARRWTMRDDVPGLGVWTTPSDPTLGDRAGDVFKYRQAVDALAVPFAYRFRVGFRWSDEDGQLVRQAEVTTRGCRQPDLRPNLVLTEVRAQPSAMDPALVRYSVTVLNEGRSNAAPVVVAATLPGETTPGGHTRTVGRLKPGQWAVVRFTGPGCAAGGTPALFVADPANAVEESDEADDERAATCPAP